jgi:arylsulfatase A-like enzyme
MRRLLDSPWLYFGLAGVLLIAAIASQFRLGPPQKPEGTFEQIPALAQRDDLNVVFLLIDTLRADHLGSYGYDRPTSPNMDRLARKGIRFARVEAQSSWTKTSMASLWTGLYPQRNGIHRYGDGLPDAAVMPAEIFRDAGYKTAGVYRNSWVGANFGFGQGFDLYVKTAPNFARERLKVSNPSASPLKGNDLDVTESAIEFIASNHDERFFVYVHYMDVHQYTYDSDSDLFGTRFADLYDNAIHWLDINVDRLTTALELLGLLEKTIIVIASDHGEGFFEHGFEGHAKGLYKEVQHTPWLISLPFDLPEPIVVDAQVANIDVWPTLLDLVGLPPLPDADGVSAVPAIMAAARGEPIPEAFRDRTLFAQIDRRWGKTNAPHDPSISILREPNRMYRRLLRPAEDELFDHTTDPDELENVLRHHPELAEELRAEIATFLENNEPAWETMDIELDEMRLNQLRALGYKIE